MAHPNVAARGAGRGCTVRGVTIKVFISSVTYGLRDERDGLAALLDVVEPYLPLRFEDFAAADMSPRQACLKAVKACSVYVLLLGPKYGESFADSGLSPTEEEFTLARRLGKPILVFSKVTDEPDEPAQAEFRRRVEDYVDGRFRASFTGVQDLNIATVRALKRLPAENPAPAWTVVAEPVSMRTRSQMPQVLDRSVCAPVLEIHLLPLAPGPSLASAFMGIEDRLAREGRAGGFFSDREALEIGSAGDTAWVWLPDARGGGHPFDSRTGHRYRGMFVVATSQASAFAAIPTDGMGALTDQADLTARCLTLIVAAAGQLPPDGSVAVAAVLGPMDKLFEGDPNQVGNRTRGAMRTQQDAFAVMEPKLSVPVAAVKGRAGDIAAEIAARLMGEIRSLGNR